MRSEEGKQWCRYLEQLTEKLLNKCTLLQQQQQQQQQQYYHQQQQELQQQQQASELHRQQQQEKEQHHLQHHYLQQHLQKQQQQQQQQQQQHQQQQQQMDAKRLQLLCYNIEGLKKLMNQTIDDSKLLRQRVDVLLIDSHEVVDRLYYTEKRIHQLNNCVKNDDYSKLCDIQ